MSDALDCREVSVRYGDVKAVTNLSLTVTKGETVALLGPSGAGKSTLIYAIAGFTPVAEGSISLGGVVCSTPSLTVPPEKRPVGLVFQNYAIWPHMTALENVAYPFRRAGHSPAEASHLARDLMAKVGIADFSDRRPAELSGGQQQRVGLARALARAADVYLFDEPTAHLDAPVRAAVEEEIARRRAETGAAAIYSTHDSAEALAVADRVAVMRDGTIIQTASPVEIYERPIDLWAAMLTGPVSTFRGRVLRAGNGKVEVGLGETSIVVETDSEVATETVEVLVRPEWVSPEGPIPGTIERISFRGPHTDYRLRTPFGALISRIEGPPRLSTGESTGWSIRRGWAPAA